MSNYETIPQNLGDVFKEIQRLRVLLLPYCKGQLAMDTHAELEKQLYKLELILKIEKKKRIKDGVDERLARE